MIASLMTVALHIGVLVAGALIYLVLARRGFRLNWFIFALILYVIYDAFLSRFYGNLPNFIGVEWNWTGKLMAIAAMLVIAFLPAFSRRKVGITVKQNAGSWTAWAVLAVMTITIFYFAYTGGDGRSNWETIAFQWTMPGLDEELFYRGLLLLALNEAFSGRLNILGAPIGFGGLLTCILFGAIHSLAWKSGGVAFDLATFATTGIPSIMLLWMRERTGSLLAPIIAHNVANGAFNLF